MYTKRRANKIRKSDIVIIIIIIAVALLGMLFQFHLQKKNPSTILVTVNGELYGEYSLKEEQVIRIKPGDDRYNLLEIRDGVARMTEANCPDKLCEHQKPIKNNGETIICLPNKVIVEATDKEKEKPAIDSVAG